MLQDVPTMLGGRYRIVERLGRGGMADVYRAEDTVLRRVVAIKVFRGGVERDQHLARFRAEVRTLAALTHPHLVALYDAGGDVAEPWCAMEYVDGGSLSDHEDPRPPVDVARIGVQIASALEYVHSCGIVHRDVKPSNVLLDSGGGAFLSDFGIARMVDGTRMTQSGLMIGTAAFLSPEQVRGRTAGPESDVYSLALVLLEALTARREYPGSPVESAVARLSRAPEIPDVLGAGWVSLLTAMTAEEPVDRPTPPQVADRLRAIRHAGDGRTPLPPPPRPAGFDGESGSFGTPGSSLLPVAVADVAAEVAASPAAKSPSAESPSAKSPAAKSPSAKSPSAKSPAAKSPSAKSSAAESSVTEPPAAEPSVTEPPAAEPSVTAGIAESSEAAPAAPVPSVVAEGEGRPADGGDPPSTPAVLPVAGGAVTPPRSVTLLAWLPPERRRPAAALLAGAALAAVVLGSIPLLGGGSAGGGSGETYIPQTVDATGETSPGPTLNAQWGQLPDVDPSTEVPQNVPPVAWSPRGYSPGYGAKSSPKSSAKGSATTQPTPTSTPSPSTSATATPTATGSPTGSTGPTGSASTTATSSSEPPTTSAPAGGTSGPTATTPTATTATTTATR